MNANCMNTALTVQGAIHSFDQSQSDPFKASIVGAGSCAAVALSNYAIDPELVMFRQTLSSVDFDHFSTASADVSGSVRVVERKSGSVMAYDLRQYCIRWSGRTPRQSQDDFRQKSYSMVRAAAQGKSRLLKDNIAIRGRRRVMSVEVPEPLEVLAMVTGSSTATFEDLAEHIRKHSNTKHPHDVV